MEQTTVMHNSIKRAKLSGGVLSLLLLLTLISGVESRHARAADDVTQLNRKQAVALHHAVKTLLGFKDSPKKMEEGTGGHLGGGSHLGRKSNSLKAPPQYMLDLYDKYKFRAIAHGRQTGNTARYINGEIGLVNGERMFLFNLTSVGRTERVFSAELHLHQRRTKSKNSEQLMMLHKVAPPHLTEVGSVHMTSRHNGWTETDITSGVKKCINYDHRKAAADLLAVSFRRKKNGKKSRVIPLSRFSDETAMPFLVLFSNDTQNITLDHVDPHFRPADLMEEIIDPEFGYDPTLVNGYYQPKKVLPVDDYEYPEDYSDEDEEDSLEEKDEDVEIMSFDGFDEDGEQPEAREDSLSRELPKSATPTALSPETLERQRRRRSILDNEIPEDPVQDIRPKPPYNVPHPDSGISSFPNQGTPSITPHHKVKGKGKGKGKVIYGSDLELRPHKNRLTLDRKHHKATTDEDDDLIPYPDDFLDRRRKNRRRNRRRNRKNRRGQRPHDQERQLPFPPAWEAEMQKESLRRRGGEQSSICGRRKLAVNFADIAWDDWVISPKSFDAYYCAGQCPFPLTTDVRPSNHATIQSLVHAIGLPADVPAPCCVPDELSSVSLLYFDGNDNVVLKHYPSMSVTSCACR